MNSHSRASVTDSAGAGSAGDKQFKFGDAEGVLHVNRQQANAGFVAGCRWDAVLFGPVFGSMPLLVGHSPDFSHLAGVEMGGNGQLFGCLGACRFHFLTKLRLFVIIFTKVAT
jgi:hypothetical protein